MSQIITVSTQAELINALRSVSGGDTIQMATGNYGDLRLIDRPAFDLDFSGPVRIVAADADNPPVVTGLDLRGASNLSFEGITFDYTYQDGQPIWFKPFMVSGSEGITFDGCTFDGDNARGLTAADNGYPTGFGLIVRQSSDITVADCEISGFFRGTVFGNVSGLTVSGNDVHGIRMDGLNFAAVQDVLIENNHIHDFDRSVNSADHSDMIQFWTAGTTRPSSDITIRGNTLDVGDGQQTQSIFMRNDLVDRGLSGSEMFYQNVLIENNVIVNGHAHGITVGETTGLTIRGNSVLHSDGGVPDGADRPVEIPRISVAATSTDVTITGNATSGIVGHNGQPGWTVARNAFVQDQDPNAPGWYGDVFITSSLTPTNGETGFLARPGGMLALLGAGAPETLAGAQSGAGHLDAAFQMHDTPSGHSGRVFDASVMTGTLPAGTLYAWDFGDGHTGQGRTITHTYADSGVYEATLTVVLPNGARDTAMASVGIQDPELLHLADGGQFVLQTHGHEEVVSTATSLDADGGVQLGARGITASIARTNLTPVFGSNDVTISFSLDADRGTATGEVFRLHGSFLVSVNSRGELQARAWSSTGDAVSLVSTGLRVNDGANHDMDIRLEGGHLSLWVDGNRVADAAFDGTFADVGRHNLTFGNALTATNFAGDLTAFSIAVDDGPTVNHTPAGGEVPQMAAAICMMPPQGGALSGAYDAAGTWHPGEATFKDSFAMAHTIDMGMPLI